MRYRTLGSTGIRVSEIGFGAWGIGGNAGGAVAYGPTRDDDSRRAVRGALDAGITFFDTADFYGFGHSEEVLGSALDGVRARAVIATKVGMIDASGRQDFSTEHIEGALERSLERLRTDYVDLYQLHSPPLDLLRDGRVLVCMERLRARGTVRAIGVSVRSPDDGLAAVREIGAQCLQVNFNLLDQRARENGLFELCAERGVGVIVRTPLCFGFLTGHYAANDAFSTSDHRNRWDPAQREKWAGAYRLFTSALQAPVEQTPAQFALRYCLSFPAVSAVIPGMLTIEHVSENAKASELGALLEPERAAIGHIYKQHEFFLPSRAG
jgi:aryl-alcohol dehydrogenase-like predicted oxidoreductase